MVHVGCHVSIAGGIQNAPGRAAELKCETFQVFSRSPQGGAPPKLTKDVVDEFWSEMKKNGMDRFYIHAPYYTNIASDNPTTLKNSARIIREELDRGTTLKARYVIIHLGSAKDNRDKGIKRATESVAAILKGYTGSCKLLLEISAGSGNIIGDQFEEVKALMSGTKSKALGGVCFDTCHAFASGYDLTKETFEAFDDIIGLKHIRFLHINDSMTELGSHKDRHEHIGDGKIGRKKFSVLSSIKELQLIDWVLETKHDKIEADIKILKRIRDGAKG